MRSKQSWKQSTKSRKQWNEIPIWVNWILHKWRNSLLKEEKRIREYKNNWERERERESLTNGEIVSCKISWKEKKRVSFFKLKMYANER